MFAAVGFPSAELMDAHETAVNGVALVIRNVETVRGLYIQLKLFDITPPEKNIHVRRADNIFDDCVEQCFHIFFDATISFSRSSAFGLCDQNILFDITFTRK